MPSSDFTIYDIQSTRRIDADDGEEVTLYVRPGGTKSAIVRFNTDFSSGSDNVRQIVARWESGSPIASAFTPIDITSDVELVGGGPETTLIPSASALMVDTTIPAGFTGINRCSVLAHVGPTTIKSVTVKFVILPFDNWRDISWLPQELVDIQFELRTDNAWSFGLAERWDLDANLQTTFATLRAGADIQFAVLPAIAGTPLGTDPTTLSFALRQVGNYDDPPLLALSPAVAPVTVDTNKYYALTATLAGPRIRSAFDDLNSAAGNNPRLAVFAQFTLTYGGKKFVSKGIPFFLEQPAARLT